MSTSLRSAQDAARNDIPYQMIGWHGRCEVHEKFTLQDIRNVREQFPDVLILSHPECSPEVVAASDYSGSTTAMIKYVEQTNAPRYLLLTECSMGDNIAAANPDKEMLRLCSVRCPHMNEITMEDKPLNALKKKKDSSMVRAIELVKNGEANISSPLSTYSSHVSG